MASDVASPDAGEPRDLGRGCPYPLEPNDSPGWLGREPTVDEREIVAWIERGRLPARVLHVGIGTAYLSARWGPRVVQGITKDGGEAANARELGLDALLCNKYDVRSYERMLTSPVDCVVDANIRSYRCCDPHFQEFMNLMRRSLSPDGMLVTNARGLGYLVPTSADELKKLCPDWRISTRGNVVVMRPRAGTGISGFFRRFLG